MSDTVIKVENLSKIYRLGEIGTGTISHDLNRWWARVRGKEDPFAKVGHTNDRTSKAEKGETVWALKDINFEVKQGEVLGIIGKNGAGKSTLLKLLSQVTTPTTGNIKVKGRIASLLEVGTGFHPELTGRENIFLNGAILGMTKTEIRSKFDEIVDFAGVAKYIDTPVKRYSSGMYVRLAFGVAAHLEPEILIVDEVLAVGDAEFQKKALGKMQDVSTKDGRTVLFVSHNMTAVRSLCNKGVLLKNGLIDEIGTTDKVMNKYLSQTVKNSRVDFNETAENEFVKVHCIELVNNLDGFFNIDEPMAIRIQICNKSITEKINVNLFFNTVEGSVIFATTSEMSEISIGDFICTCNIPANFLNNNTYFLDIMVVKNGETPLIYLQNIMLIEGIEPTRKTAWLGKFPGLIRPKLNWEFTYDS